MSTTQHSNVDAATDGELVDKFKDLKVHEKPPSKLDLKSSELVKSLVQLSCKNPKLVRASPHEVEYSESNGTLTTRTIWSWKMNEFKYSSVPSPFPTLARGLFTEWVPSKGGAASGTRQVKEGKDDDDGFHRVVIRGYDKFFNMNEVPWNNWEAIANHTEAPYHLTLKSNGCIIFMSALSPTQVLVTSKHSLGSVTAQEVSHAQMGEKWLNRHLDARRKTKADFAKRLWEENLTAVAELCDDSFEEHVLPYPPELTGLHLHGINRNQGTFETFSPADVTAFAEEWGFIKTAFHTLNTAKEVREFTDEIGRTGVWSGQAVEGFVVRTKVTFSKNKGTSDERRRDTPPYPPGSDYFFKVKFDEPYMTYRDWREMTKTILSGRKKNVETPSIPKSKLRRPESYAYRDWVTREINRDPGAFTNFGNGKGIIAVREKFLKWLETPDGKAQLGKHGDKKRVVLGSKAPAATDEKWERAVIVPIAVPGCGKTVVSLALARLFGFGHTQSDDVKAKKTASQFEKNICDLLASHDTVIADRNNHLAQHRGGIRNAVRKVKGGPVKLLALNWTFSLPTTTIHRICSDRVLGRGERHQSLVGDVSKAHEDIIWKFIEGAEELQPAEVDKTIQMNIEETPEEAVQRVVDEIVPLFGLEMPTEVQIKEACEKALAYTPTVKKDVGGKGSLKAAPVRYFALLVELDLHDMVTTAINESQDVAPMITTLWESLMTKGRVAHRPHVTIVHEKSLPQSRPLWDICSAVHDAAAPPLFRFRLSHLVTDGDVMALAVEEVGLVDEYEGSKEGRTFLTDMPDDVRSRLHITVGTKNKDTAPYLAGKMVEKWRAGETGEEVQVLQLPHELGLVGKGRLRGLAS